MKTQKNTLADLIVPVVAVALLVGCGKPQPPAVALEEAAVKGDVAAIRQHITAGSNLDVHNPESGATALHTPAFLCHPEIVQALLAAGADKEVRNSAGATALESVQAPFELVVGVYDLLGQMLGPAGLTLDYERIKAERPRIAQLLRGE